MHISRTIVISALVMVALCSGANAQTELMAPKSTSTSQQQQDFAVILAKAELAKQGVTPKNTSKTDYGIALSTTAKEIRAQRSSGLGWGAIAKKMGLNWGKVVSESRHSNNALREGRMRNHDAHSKAKGDDKAGGVKGGDGHAAGAGAGKK